MDQSHKQIYLIRHGETEWTTTRRHTGLTDIPLTDEGRIQAKWLVRKLKGKSFAKVYTSPLKRAKETCAIAGLLKVAELEPNLVEWDYGSYEGLTTAQIREKVPGWNLFRNGVPGGETIEAVTARADRVIEKVLSIEGDVALFSSGHFSRALAARWIGFTAAEGRCLHLSTASVSILSFEREIRVIREWNVTS